jgi:hypothetical protein
MNSLNFTLGIGGLYWTLTIIFASLGTLWLLLRSGHGYSVQDTMAHSVDFGGEIKEGHGGLTMFLWIFYIFMFVWTVIYFVQHAAEFAIIFAGGGG